MASAVQKENYMANAESELKQGLAILGIEFGSTRIKAVAIDSENNPIASGSYDWENQLIDGLWTYSMKAVKLGLQTCYSRLKADILSRYGVTVTSFKAIGISAMMHGYIALDKDGDLLVPFRTWRNTNTKKASDELSNLFSYPVPERWSISHLYQSIIEKQEHLRKLDSILTLSAYVHMLLTGNKVVGIGDASGMFPIDVKNHRYNLEMTEKFDTLIKNFKYDWKLLEVLPKIRLAGENAGYLTAEGAMLIDQQGDLKPGIPFCPPEGDAGTGMVATNSIRQKTGNVSAGTSVFVMVVLDHELEGFYSKSIDLVTTPDGSLVAMSHGNNCTGEYDHWISLLGEAIQSMGLSCSKAKLYDILLSKALEGEKDCGGLMAYNYIAGETMTGIYEGRPLFIRTPESKLNLANFMRSQLFSSLAVIRIGMEILFEKENVKLETLNGHGGFFKTAEVGQIMMSAAMHTPVTVMKTAGEGGPWGIALLASFMANGKGCSLVDFLQDKVFASSDASTIMASKQDMDGFDKFMDRYKSCLAVEETAAVCLH